MKVLVVGSGAREHALAWVLDKSPKVDQVYSVPGTVSHSICLGGVPDDPIEMANVAAAYAIDLTVVGPETPLAAGIVDHFRQRNLTVFGPTQAAARLESSKSFARHLMLTHSIPSPDFVVFDEYNAARNFLMKYRRPVVVKADGLAAGKGVFVCANRDQAMGALDECMVNRTFDSAGDVVVFEEWLETEDKLPFEWAIIGAASNGSRVFQPKETWTDSLIELFERRDVPIFFKGNMDRDYWKNWREEFPAA